MNRRKAAKWSTEHLLGMTLSDKLAEQVLGAPRSQRLLTSSLT